MATISGIGNGLILAFINLAAEHVSNQQNEFRFFVLFIISFVLYIYSQRYALSKTTIAIENAIRKVRIRVADKIRKTELRFIENAGRGEMYLRLTQDSNLISQTVLILVSAAQSAMVLIFSVFYVAWLSPLSFFITVVVLSIAVLLYLSMETQVSGELQTATLKESEFFEALNHILDGFKEIKINRRKSDDLFKHVEKISNETEQLKVNVGIRLIASIMFSETSFYFLLAVLVFIVPLFSHTHSDVIFKITAATLFIIGPIGMIVNAMPMLSRTNVALNNIYKLESELDAMIPSTYETELPEIPPAKFQEVRIEEASFEYTDKGGKSLFSIGPINTTIKPGELLFIVGGNGSGKSTFLKLLTGLYYPIKGCCYLDGEEVDQVTYQNYRELFSIIFTDFHLFDRFYGLENVDEKKLKALLQLMELDKKTKYRDGKFTNVNLSTGQKKRLAFIAAILEDKPIYIFDELAADQDPQFRKYFYEVILQDLKKQGKTIIAVTHDDHYFNTADRVLKMEYGQLINYDEQIIR
ncbi:cyclic peptide export ABC transporter [Candidatus Parabeggiatoa sp. HSG14]|uniref:cyclic peptide export ABC transporter n=1 Tax=Candidatus Parabeggiatoa sp. HSG14 TaxID=3055593 RepID=UPI0032E3C659